MRAVLPLLAAALFAAGAAAPGAAQPPAARADAGPAAEGGETAPDAGQGSSSPAPQPESAGAPAKGEEAARDEEIFGSSPEPGPTIPETGVSTSKSADETARDADIFGESPVQAPAPGGPAQTRDKASDEEADRLRPVDVGALQRGAEGGHDKLAVGGRFFLRGELTDYEDEPPAGTNLLTAPSLLDVYLDGRPDDRVRAYARGRLSYDFTAVTGSVNAFGQSRTAVRTQLDQLWVNFDIGRTVFVTAGKLRLKWGAGRFWNPTDFLNRQRLDPLAVIDERLGVSLVKLQVPLPDKQLNFVAVADLEEATRPDQIGGALRAEFVLGPAELTASVASRRDTPLRIGADISVGVGLFDLRAEAAVLHGVSSPFYSGRFDPGALPPVLPAARDREDDWIPQAVLGFDVPIRYSEQDSVMVGAEYFFNDAGYEDASLYPWLLAGTVLGPVPTRCANLDLPATSFECQAVQSFPPPGLFTPFYLGRHYVAAYAALVNPGSWNNTSFTLSTIGNLSDRSFVSRLDYRVRVLTYLDVNAYGSAGYGENGEFDLAVRIPAAPGATGPFASGIDRPAALYTVGAGVILNL